VKVSHSNYDTHHENFDFHIEQLGEFDRPFAALLDDLADRGMLDDVLVVMAGDAQMAPEDLSRVVEPVALGRASYVKGNRFWHARKTDMPLARRLAGRVLALATRLATGLAVDDCQCGYTAISRAAALGLPLDDRWPRFGYPNDLLGMLAARGLSVVEVPVRPVYGDEQSGVRAWHALSILLLIARRYVRERPVRRALGSGADRPIDDLLSEAE
ncbi:MAG TPA: DUF1501 domain-containing protein, partial [Polyangiaceae bacterium]|nr:DUF1501 domain-containing protein [Polyangiaceae bacterium]